MAVSITGLIFTILDTLINLDLRNSVYMTGSFDYRGTLIIQRLDLQLALY